MYDLKLDSDNLIVQTNLDGGDCAARMGLYFTLLKIRERLEISNLEWPMADKLNDYWSASVSKLVTPEGKLYRYPRPPYNSLEDVSRDQTMPMVIAAGFMGDVLFLRNTYQNIMTNKLLFQNGDLCGPQDFGVLNRACAMAGLPAHHGSTLEIYSGDIQLIGSVLVRCSKAQKNSDDVGDDINLTLYLLQSIFSRSTLLAKTARGIYKRRRPYGIQYAWDHYFRPETGANPLNELARPVISRLFG